MNGLNLDALRTFAVQRHVRAVAAIHADHYSGKAERIAMEDATLAADLDKLQHETVKASILSASTLSLEPTTTTPYNPGRVLLDARTTY